MGKIGPQEHGTKSRNGSRNASGSGSGSGSATLATSAVFVICLVLCSILLATQWSIPFLPMSRMDTGDLDDPRIAATLEEMESPKQNQKPKMPTTTTTTTAVSKLSAEMDDPKTLNVHVVAHTHDDVGWLKTVDQYFYGLNMTIQYACVNDILDSVVSSLVEHPSRTFTYVELKFFSLWWDLQDDAVKDTVRYLVANQQLGFVNGGWCMHDEAATHYIGMIDQTTLGHRFLKKQLGVIPKVGWQLDPFGHSASQASLFASKVGFDALYFGRIDYQDLRLRHYTQECEGLWNSSRNLEDTTVFWGLTGSYEGNYGAPRGFCFDIGCEDPLITGMDQTSLEKSVHMFLGDLRVQSDRTKGNHIMLTMGSDFQYQRAHINYANLDLLISTIHELQRLNKVDVPALFGSEYERVNVFYSSPDYYTQCKYDELKASSSASSPSGRKSHLSPIQMQNPIQFSVKKDDFMPYSDCEHCFWTGYFTSRAGLKRLERVASSYLLSSRQIESLLDYMGQRDSVTCEQELHILEDASGVAQHHDGVSGTSKQHVADDYAKRLQAGINGVSECSIRKIKRLLLGSNATDYLQDMQYCQLLNETRCGVSQRATMGDTKDVYIVVYNGLAQPRSSIIHLPVSSKAMYSVKQVGQNHSATTLEAMPAYDAVEDHKALYRIAFSTGKVPPLGVNVFQVRKVDSRPLHPLSVTKSSWSAVAAKERRIEEQSASDDVHASNEFISVTFDGSTGRIKEMNSHNVSVKLNPSWGYYTSFDDAFDAPENPDNNPSSRETQNSGAYVFRPSVPDQKLRTVEPISVTFFNTPVGIEVHTKYEVPWIKTISRVFVGQPYLEIEYTVGPIPMEDGRGKEIVSRLSSPIKSDGTFYTDSNGREFMKRDRDFRNTWNLNVYEPVAGNYYPVNAAIYVEEKGGKALTIVTDRTQGGSSLKDGALELMVQRRTLVDDARGVGEPMNETDGGMTPYPPHGNATRLGDGVVIKGRHYILVGDEGGAALARSMMDLAFVEPLVFVGSESAKRQPPFINFGFSGLKNDALPPNVMLLTRAIVHGEKEPTILVRIGHQYGIGEDPSRSETVEVDLAKCVPEYEIGCVVELTLSANQEHCNWIERRFHWTHPNWNSSGNIIYDGCERAAMVVDTKVQVKPMDIRTFFITLK